MLSRRRWQSRGIEMTNTEEIKVIAERRPIYANSGAGKSEPKQAKVWRVWTEGVVRTGWRVYLQVGKGKPQIINSKYYDQIMTTGGADIWNERTRYDVTKA